MAYCDSCITQDATTAIILDDGQYFEVCDNCIFSCIVEYATKETQVHTMDKLDLVGVNHE